MLRFGADLAVLLWAAHPTRADEWQTGGHLKTQHGISRYASSDIRRSAGARQPYDGSLELRASGGWKDGSFEASLHAEELLFGAEGLGDTRDLDLAALGPCRSDACRLFDLEHDEGVGDDASARSRIDRMQISYLSDRFVVRAGRQAITWGNGLGFQVLDLFNPFSPTETDKDYKAGDDMLYGQYLFEGGDDIQALMVPRRARDSGRVDDDDSSLAIKARARLDAPGIDVDLLAARHYADTVLGAAAVKEAFGALIRTDVALTIGDQSTMTGMLVNVDRGFTVFDLNFYAFVEYYHNPFGVGDAPSLPPAEELRDRVARGDLFVLGRDYLSTGGRIEASPLLNLFPSCIVNLHDTSRIFQLRAVYDWREDLSLTVGIDLPDGDRGSELGGILIPAGSAEESASTIGPAKRAYARLTYFF